VKIKRHNSNKLKISSRNNSPFGTSSKNSTMLKSSTTKTNPFKSSTSKAKNPFENPHKSNQTNAFKGSGGGAGGQNKKFFKGDDRSQHQQSRRSQEAPRGTGQRVKGFVKRHPDGYGFLIPDESGIPDIYVPKNIMVGVMTNDKIEVGATRDGDRLRGEGLRILSRETKRVSGQIKKMGPTQGRLRDESFGWGDDLVVTIPPTQQVKDGDWVLVAITSYPDSSRGFLGEVEAVIGDVEDALNDNLRVLGTANIPFKFSARCLEEARHISTEVTDEDREGRVDLRDKHLITIDGKTAKDYDDAIYVERTQKGFRLWVAIADVSHYVKPGSAIDKDAYERGTSTYFPNFVAPMLPESLSNEMCSLKPKVDRLALTCEMEVDFSGVISNYTVYESVINSHARVTYGEAQEVIDGNVPDRLQHVAKDIKLASELAHILMKRRYQNGSLNLEIPETTIELGDDGIPKDILRGERLFAHKLIEELMLAANIAVALYLDEHNTPALYRIHEEPKRDAIAVLEGYLENFGYGKRLSGVGVAKKITAALQEFAGTPQSTVLNILALRSMAQARYSPDNVGHFGLGFEHYAHFTSPIRRYPDLIIHRQLKSVILGNKGYRTITFGDLETAGTMLSACEQRSVKAERQIISIKKARFMQGHLGEELDGVVSSVTKFGLFVLLRKFDVDGLVRVEELGNDYWFFDEENLALVAKRSGQRYEIGAELKIQVAAVDIQNGRIDFVLATGDEEDNATSQKTKSIQERRPSKNNRERVREARVSGSGGKNKAEQVRSGGKNAGKNRRRRRR
jgi:ribonuclease R